MQTTSFDSSTRSSVTAHVLPNGARKCVQRSKRSRSSSRRLPVRRLQRTEWNMGKRIVRAVGGLIDLVTVFQTQRAFDEEETKDETEDEEDEDQDDEDSDEEGSEEDEGEDEEDEGDDSSDEGTGDE